MLNERLELLDYTNSLFNKVDLSNSLVIACQHLLKTNFIMFEYLFERGLQPQNTFILGKCYSTDKTVVEKFREKGAYVDSNSTAFDSHISFDDQFEKYVTKFIDDVQEKAKFNNYDKIILIDDGGYLLYCANKTLKEIGNVVAVEQTASGYRKLKHNKLIFPVINVARSNSKLEFESPFIVEFGLKELWKHFSKTNPQRILVMGVGAIGSNVLHSLKENFDPDSYDINPNLSDTSQINSELGNYDLIIGCTGEPVIKSRDYNLLKKGVILASLSSSDREFEAVELRRLLPRTTDCHKEVFVNGITLVNSGFPVNFNGRNEIESTNLIQLTRALMFSAICLTNQHDYKSGLVELDRTIQDNIISKFKEINEI